MSLILGENKYSAQKVFQKNIKLDSIKQKMNNQKAKYLVNNNIVINCSKNTNNIHYYEEITLNINNLDANSTFSFTGKGIPNFNNNIIISNYLQNPKDIPLFDCKSISTISNTEKNELISLKENSFAFSFNSSNEIANNENKNNNEKLMSVLKKINCDNSVSVSSPNKKKENKNNKKIKTISNNKTKNKKKSNITHFEGIKNQKEKKGIKKCKHIYIIMILLINILVVMNFIVKEFEPPVSALFNNNDHDSYVYKTSLLSQDTRMIMNK